MPLIGGAPRVAARAAAATMLLAGCAAPPAAVPAPQPAPPELTRTAAPTPGAGLYTQAQADHGRRVFDSVCSACHGAGEFRGQIFAVTWMARPVGHFFQHISTAMPQDHPGSLSPEEYAAVVAYVLQLNGRPPGDRALSTDPRLLEALAWPR